MTGAASPGRWFAPVSAALAFAAAWLALALWLPGQDFFLVDDFLLLTPARDAVAGRIEWLWHKPIPSYWRPASTGFFILLYQAFGTAAAPYKAVQFALHALNGWLLFRLLSRWGAGRVPALAAGLLFVFWYGTREAVVWVGTMPTVLQATGFLLTMLLLERGRLFLALTVFCVTYFLKETFIVSAIPVLWYLAAQCGWWRVRRGWLLVFGFAAVVVPAVLLWHVAAAAFGTVTGLTPTGAVASGLALPARAAAVATHLLYCLMPLGYYTARWAFYAGAAGMLLLMLAGACVYFRRLPQDKAERRQVAFWLLVVLCGTATTLTSKDGFMDRYAYISIIGMLPLLLLALRSLYGLLPGPGPWRPRLCLALFIALLAANYGLYAKFIVSGRFHRAWRMAAVRVQAEKIARAGCGSCLVVFPDDVFSDRPGGISAATVRFFLPPGCEPQLRLIPAAERAGTLPAPGEVVIE